MAVRIRMKRTGGKNKPCYRVVVADARFQRDGRFIENIGFYDPVHDNEKIDLERVNYWLGCGAQPSKTVASLIKRAENPVKKKDDKTEKKTKTAEKKAEKTEPVVETEKEEATVSENADAEMQKEKVAEKVTVETQEKSDAPEETTDKDKEEEVS